MTLDGLDVVNANEPSTEGKLLRVWIGVRDQNGADMFTRRSVILGPGRNELYITWTKGVSGIPLDAAVFKRPNDSEAWVVSPIRNIYYVRMGPGDTVALRWVLDTAGLEGSP